MSQRTGRGAWGVVILAAVVAWAVNAQAAEPPVEAASSAEGQSAGEPADLFKVPDGTPEELIEYIDQLKVAQPEVSDYAAVIEFRKKVARAVLEASEKILAAEAGDEQRKEAAQSKLVALVILTQLDDRDAKIALAKLPEEFEKAGLPEVARDAQLFGFETRLRTAAGADAEQYRKLAEEITAFLKTGPVGRQEAALAMRTAQGTELVGDKQLAVDVSRELGKLLTTSEDEVIASVGRRLEGSARRMDLLGNAMTLQGIKLSGEPLDWPSYQGKVVLVDFWATWCGPCLAEIPNIRQNYDLYHDRGFDVVAISLDDDREQLAEFVQQRELPWTVVFDGDPGAPSMADYYGVMGIPTMMLVNKEGKVVSLEARGHALDEALETLLGPVEPKEEKADEEPESESVTQGAS